MHNSLYERNDFDFMCYESHRAALSIYRDHASYQRSSTTAYAPKKKHTHALVSSDRMSSYAEFCFPVKELANSKVKLVPFDVSKITATKPPNNAFRR